MAYSIAKPAVLTMAGVAVLSSAGFYTWRVSERPPGLEIFVFNTPGSPAVFLRTPDDRRILIDGGANADIIRRLSKVLPFYSRRVDEVILTLPDTKHLGGLIETVKRYRVSRAYLPAETDTVIASADDEAPLDFFRELTEQQKVPVERVGRGQELVLGHGLSGGAVLDVRLEVLFPLPASEFVYSSASPPQIIWRLVYGETSLLFMGGASRKIQKRLSADIARTDVLIFSRNPDAGNLEPLLLNKAAPTFLVFSRSASYARIRTAASPDLLAGFMYDHQFNIQIDDSLHIVANGQQVEINKSPGRG